jgi:hypothetical protein
MTALLVGAWFVAGIAAVWLILATEEDPQPPWMVWVTLMGPVALAAAILMVIANAIANAKRRARDRGAAVATEGKWGCSMELSIEGNAGSPIWAIEEVDGRIGPADRKNMSEHKFEHGMIIEENAEKCIFCGEYITRENVMNCRKSNLPPLTCGGRPHAFASVQFGSQEAP